VAYCLDPDGHVVAFAGIGNALHVRAEQRPAGPPKCARMATGSIGPVIRELLQAYLRMPATVIAERTGWDRGLTVLFAAGAG
jgi:hypothetical protein